MKISASLVDLEVSVKAENQLGVDGREVSSWLFYIRRMVPIEVNQELELIRYLCFIR